ncbi:MAG: hypothetical protein ACC609_03805 [Methanobacterium formicicum]
MVNNNEIMEKLDILKKELGILDENMKNVRENKEDLTDLLEIINEIEQSWSGSWIGYHANLYYNDFQKPPTNEKFDIMNGLPNLQNSNWEEKSKSDIIRFINARYNGSKLAQISSNFPVQQLLDIKTQFCAELAFIRSFNNFENEIAILDKLDDENDVKWRSPERILNEIRPKNGVTRDQKALSQGVRTPPHIDCRVKVLSLIDLISYTESFLRLSNRLTRQVESRMSIKNGIKVDNDQSEKGKNNVKYVIGLLISAIIAVSVIKNYFSDYYLYVFFVITMLLIVFFFLLIIYYLIKWGFKK